MAAVRIQVEARRAGAGAGMGGSPPAATRLANVVRRPRRLPAKPLVCQSARAFTPQHAGGDSAPRAKSFPGKGATIYPRPGLRISVYDPGRTSRQWYLVETRGER